MLIATDEGIEFCVDALYLVLIKEQADNSSWDETISGLDNSKAILIKMYDGAPSFFGAYYLFAE